MGKLFSNLFGRRDMAFSYITPDCDSKLVNRDRFSYLGTSGYQERRIIEAGRRRKPDTATILATLYCPTGGRHQTIFKHAGTPERPGTVNPTYSK